jgi:hypothetical protein
VNNVNFSQQTQRSDANSIPHLKTDEIFTSKLEPLIRIPESVPWNRSEWLNLLIGRIFREMQTCKVTISLLKKIVHLGNDILNSTFLCIACDPDRKKVFLNEIEDKVRDALDQLPKRSYLGPIELHKFDFGNKQWDIKGVRCFKPFGNDNDELVSESTNNDANTHRRSSKKSDEYWNLICE